MPAMRWTVVVPGALLPAPIAADVVGAVPVPALTRLVAHARTLAPQPAAPACHGAAHWDWLWRRFGGRGDTPVTAPYAWRALDDATLDAGSDGTLWQADPIHFSIARDHMLAVPLVDDEALDAGQTQALAAAADTEARAAGARVQVVGGHWFLHVDRGWSLQTAPRDAVLGESLTNLLPGGADGLRWQRLLTAIQIAWHDHPVNAAREARGLRSVNGLWLHGGGSALALPACGLAQVASDEAAVRGWALAAGVPATMVGPAATELTQRADALAVWPHLFLARSAEAWHPWAQALAQFDDWLAAVAARAFDAGAAVELVLCGRRQSHALLLARRDRWCAWRRTRLAAVLAEPPERAT